MEINKIYCEDARETINKMTDESIDCLVTSPPYWALRDYGEESVSIWDSGNGCLHEWELKEYKLHSGRGDAQQSTKYSEQEPIPDKLISNAFCHKCGAWRGSLGLEPDFSLYIKHLCDIFEMFKPKLKKGGTIWVNLGDTYASGTRDNNFSPDKTRLNSKEGRYIGNWHEQPNRRLNNYPAKSLCAIPDRFKIEMIDRGWICRNEIIWHKPNCMPQSVKDRFTVDYEKLFFFVKSRKYYFEQQFEPYDMPLDRWGGDKMRNSSHKYIDSGELGKFGATSMFRKGRPVRPNDKGKNKRCVWETPIPELEGFHNWLAEQLYESDKELFRNYSQKYIKLRQIADDTSTIWTIPTQGNPESHFAIYPDKLIETPIKAGCPKGGIVYDPFGGSGTTAEVCIRLDRQFIISEINPKYAFDIAEKRIKQEQNKLRLF